MKESGWRQTGSKGIFAISFFTLVFLFVKALTGPGAEAVDVSPLLGFLTAVCLYGVFHLLLQRKKLVTKAASPLYLLLLISAVSIWIRLLILPSIYTDWLVWQSAVLLACGLSGCLCLYRSASRIWASREGLVAAALYALWPAQLFFARGDILVALGETLLLAVMMCVLEAYYAKSFRAALIWTLLSSLCCVGAVWIWFGFVWVLPGLFLFFLLRKRSGLANELDKAHSGVILFFLFLAGLLVSGAAAVGVVRWVSGVWPLPHWQFVSLPAADWNQVFWLLDEQAGLLWQGELFWNHSIGRYFFQLFYWFVLLCACIGVGRLVRRTRADALPAVCYSVAGTLFYLFLREPAVTWHMPMLACLMLPAAYGLTARSSVPRQRAGEAMSEEPVFLDALLNEVRFEQPDDVSEEPSAPEGEISDLDSGSAAEPAEGEASEVPEEMPPEPAKELPEVSLPSAAAVVSELDFAKSLDQVLSAGTAPGEAAKEEPKKLPEIADVFSSSGPEPKQPAQETIPSKRDPLGRLLDELYNSGSKQ